MELALKIVDFILFRVIAGLCLLVSTARFLDVLSEQYRSVENGPMVWLISLATIVFCANLLVWIFGSDYIVPSKSNQKKYSVSHVIIVNFIHFLVTTVAVYLFNYGYGWFYLYKTFAQSGAVFYGAVILGDVSFILIENFKDFIHAESFKTRIGWLFLWIYFLFFVAVNIYSSVVALELEFALNFSVVFLCVTFIASSYQRFSAHRVYLNCENIVDRNNKKT